MGFGFFGRNQAAMEEFPGNSHTARIKKLQEEAAPEETEAAEPSEETGEPKKVLNGKVTTRKPSLGARIKDMFSSGDNEQSFPDYLVNNVAIPMIQEMIINMVGQTLDGIKNGVEDRISGGASSERRSQRTTSYGTGRPVINYNAQYRSSPSRPASRSVSQQAPRVTIRRSNRIEDIFLDNREDGLDIIADLEGKIDGFGHCTVADLYSFIPDMGIKTTDEAWGWEDLSAARVRRLATGQFQLVMPRPSPIEFSD